MVKIVSCTEISPETGKDMANFTMDTNELFKLVTRTSKNYFTQFWKKEITFSTGFI